MGELAAPVDPWPGAPIIIDDRYRRAVRLGQRGSIMSYTSPEPPRAPYPHDGMLTQPAPRKPRRVGLFVVILTATLAALCGIGALASLAGSDTELRPGRSAVGVVTPSPTPFPPDDEPVGDPTWQLAAKDLRLSVKVRDKECFGSAGCNVEYRIDAAITDGARKQLENGDRGYEITYEVRGFADGKQIGTLEVSPDGTFSQDSFQFGQTASEGTKLKVKATEVSPL